LVENSVARLGVILVEESVEMTVEKMVEMKVANLAGKKD